jgi:NAD+ diphosphatase
MRKVNFYAGLALDRLAERRRDGEFLAAQRAAIGAQIVPVWRSRNLVLGGDVPRAVFLSFDRIQTFGHEEDPLIFLGEHDSQGYFAIDLSRHEENTLATIIDSGNAQFVDLRSVGSVIDRQEGALLAYSRALMHWHARHRFCGVCGSATRSESAGHVRRCSNANCNAEHFPRTDPAVIMLVTHGDHALLGRQKSWPAGQHSTLAGFVEPGESLEDAVAREVFEEAGVRVRNVHYHSSQPWPFPSSIMLGFHATADALDLQIDPEELENAAWFSCDYIRTAHEPERFRLPRADSIARRLIEDWLADHG